MMEIKTKDIGFAILVMSLMITWFIFGMFHEYRIVSDLLLFMYLLGMTTVIGLFLMSEKKKKPKKKVKDAGKK